MTEEEFERYLAGQLMQITREEEDLKKFVKQAEEKAGVIAGLLAKKYVLSNSDLDAVAKIVGRFIYAV